MQIVQHLEVQLTKEKSRLEAMMAHLHPQPVGGAREASQESLDNSLAEPTVSRFQISASDEFAPNSIESKDISLAEAGAEVSLEEIMIDYNSQAEVSLEEIDYNSQAEVSQEEERALLVNFAHPGLIGVHSLDDTILNSPPAFPLLAPFSPDSEYE